MKINRFAVALGVVAVAGFLAGRADFPAGSNALAQDHPGGDHPHSDHPQQDGDQAMSPELMEMFAKMDAAGKPGKHHELLKKMVGTWEGTYSWTPGPGIPPMEMEGTATRELIMGGRYIKETVKSTFHGQEFEGIGYIGYNNLTGTYEMCWIDSQSTGIYTESGAYDPSTKTLRTFAEHTNPMTGKVMHCQGELDMSSPGRQVMVGHCTGPNGEWFKMFEGTFEKVD